MRSPTKISTSSRTGKQPLTSSAKPYTWSCLMPRLSPNSLAYSSDGKQIQLCHLRAV